MKRIRGSNPDMIVCWKERAWHVNSRACEGREGLRRSLLDVPCRDEPHSIPFVREAESLPIEPVIRWVSRSLLEQTTKQRYFYEHSKVTAWSKAPDVAALTAAADREGYPSTSTRTTDHSKTCLCTADCPAGRQVFEVRLHDMFFFFLLPSCRSAGAARRYSISVYRRCSGTRRLA